jgi:hypothetical protein
MFEWGRFFFKKYHVLTQIPPFLHFTSTMYLYLQKGGRVRYPLLLILGVFLLGCVYTEPCYIGKENIGAVRLLNSTQKNLTFVLQMKNFQNLTLCSQDHFNYTEGDNYLTLHVCYGIYLEMFRYSNNTDTARAFALASEVFDILSGDEVSVSDIAYLLAEVYIEAPIQKSYLEQLFVASTSTKVRRSTAPGGGIDEPFYGSFRDKLPSPKTLLRAGFGMFKINQKPIVMAYGEDQFPDNWLVRINKVNASNLHSQIEDSYGEDVTNFTRRVGITSEDRYGRRIGLIEFGVNTFSSRDSTLRFFKRINHGISEVKKARNVFSFMRYISNVYFNVVNSPFYIKKARSFFSGLGGVVDVFGRFNQLVHPLLFEGEDDGTIFDLNKRIEKMHRYTQLLKYIDTTTYSRKKKEKKIGAYQRRTVDGRKFGINQMYVRPQTSQEFFVRETRRLLGNPQTQYKPPNPSSIFFKDQQPEPSPIYRQGFWENGHKMNALEEYVDGETTSGVFNPADVFFIGFWLPKLGNTVYAHWTGFGPEDRNRFRPTGIVFPIGIFINGAIMAYTPWIWVVPLAQIPLLIVLTSTINLPIPADSISAVVWAAKWATRIDIARQYIPFLNETSPPANMMECLPPFWFLPDYRYGCRAPQMNLIPSLHPEHLKYAAFSLNRCLNVSIPFTEIPAFIQIITTAAFGPFVEVNPLLKWLNEQLTRLVGPRFALINYDTYNNWVCILGKAPLVLVVLIIGGFALIVFTYNMWTQIKLLVVIASSESAHIDIDDLESHIQELQRKMTTISHFTRTLGINQRKIMKAQKNMMG